MVHLEYQRADGDFLSGFGISLAGLMAIFLAVWYSVGGADADFLSGFGRVEKPWQFSKPAPPEFDGIFLNGPVS